VLAPAARVAVRRPLALLDVLGGAAVSRWRLRQDPHEARRQWRTGVLAVLVADRVRREGVTHVHCHFATAAAEVAVPAGRMAGVPVTVTAHAKDVYHRDNERVLGRRLAGASAVVTVSEFNRAHLARVLPRTRVVHVPNGVALGPLNERTVGERSAPVLCVARLVAKKGIDTLLRGIALLAPDDPALRLRVIGTGPLEDELKALADELGIASLVRWDGPQPAAVVEAAYAEAGVVALPCRIDGDGDRDGLPTVLVESLARGVPVVSTDVVGIPELVVHGETGLLVAPDDPDALASALAKLRSDPDLARSLGRHGRELVRSAYDPAEAATALQRVWAEVAR
jgi:glycosyltransferase involved in cell wall biosynthesis